MRFQTAMSADRSEAIFRSVQNCYTKTDTASTIPIGTPVILSTGTMNGYHVQIAATSTAIVNNLLVGVAHAAIGPEDVGLAQCYGYDSDAVVYILGANPAQAVGDLLIPNVSSFVQGGLLVTVTAATATASHTTVSGLGGLVVLCEAIASSSATSAGAKKVFLRCM